MTNQPARFWSRTLRLCAPVMGLALAAGLLLNLAHAAPNTPTVTPATKAVTRATISPTVGNMDVVFVLDNTGSMEFDTICYGCWARCLDTNTTSGAIDYGAYPNGGNNAYLIPSGECATAADHYKQYPANGRVFPFDFYGAAMTNLRTGNSGLPRPEDRNGDGDFADTNEDFIMLEAEFYSANSSSWDPATRSAGRGYWAMQRNWEGKAYAIDGYGYGGRSFYARQLSGAVRHHPYYADTDGSTPFGRFYTLAEAQSGNAPMLEYNFMPTWSGNTYIYVRYLDGPDDTAARIFWTIANSSGTNLQTVAQKDGTSQNSSDWHPNGCDAWNCGNSEGNIKWRWELLNSSGNALTANQLYRLRIYAGQPGFEMDRILITSRKPTESDMNNATLGSFDSVRLLREAAATAGSAQGLAADPCNPIFGLSVTPADCTTRPLTQPVNNLADPLFGGMQPIRGMQEAARELITRLDPRVDQVGLVHFSGDAYQDSQLECIRSSAARRAAGAQLANYPLPAAAYPEYDELTCADPAQAGPGTLPISFTNALISLENIYPSYGDTDIADGLRRGLHMLGLNTDNDDSDKHANDCAWNNNSVWWRLRRLDSTWLNQPGADSKANPIVSHCAREQQQTQPALVLLTDGIPTNTTPGDNADCYANPTDPLPYPNFFDSDRKYRCIMYYADLAARQNVPVCAIGLGAGVDAQLLQAIADRTGGQAFFAPSQAQLDFTAIVNGCLTPLGADLAVTASPTEQVVPPGQNITFTLVSSNTGPVATVSATLVNTWTPTDAVTAATAPGCAVDVPEGVITCTTDSLGLLTPVTVPVTLTLRPDFLGTITSQTEITSTGGVTDTRPANNYSAVQFAVSTTTVSQSLYLPVIFKITN